MCAIKAHTKLLICMFSLPKWYPGFPTKSRLSVPILHPPQGQTLKPWTPKSQNATCSCFLAGNSFGIPRYLSQINLLHHSLRKWELGDARAQHWGSPGEGHTQHWGCSPHLSLLYPHSLWVDKGFSTGMERPWLWTILQTATLELGRQESRVHGAAPAALIEFTGGVLSLGFHTISLGPSCVCVKLRLMVFLCGWAQCHIPEMKGCPTMSLILCCTIFLQRGRFLTHMAKIRLGICIPFVLGGS